MTITTRETHHQLVRLADEITTYRQAAADYGLTSTTADDNRAELLPVLADAYGALLDHRTDTEDNR